jgi:hypothetical protein
MRGTKISDLFECVLEQTGYCVILMVLTVRACGGLKCGVGLALWIFTRYEAFQTTTVYEWSCELESVRLKAICTTDRLTGGLGITREKLFNIAFPVSMVTL